MQNSFRALIFSVLVCSVVIAKERSFVEVSAGILIDPITSQVWTRDDPDDVNNYREARSYCKQLRLGGYNWRLPSMRELERVYEYDREGEVFRLEHTRYWSFELASDRSENLIFDVIDGEEDSFFNDDSDYSLAYIGVICTGNK